MGNIAEVLILMPSSDDNYPKTKLSFADWSIGEPVLTKIRQWGNGLPPGRLRTQAKCPRHLNDGRLSWTKIWTIESKSSLDAD
jgi:hypothetical protein